jgi:hypothetical protein
MEAVAAPMDGTGVSPHALRTMVGSEVAVHTASERLEGTLLSCTERSLWVVAGDVDHLVALPRVLAVTPR